MSFHRVSRVCPRLSEVSMAKMPTSGSWADVVVDRQERRWSGCGQKGAGSSREQSVRRGTKGKTMGRQGKLRTTREAVWTGLSTCHGTPTSAKFWA